MTCENLFFIKLEKKISCGNPYMHIEFYKRKKYFEITNCKEFSRMFWNYFKIYFKNPIVFNFAQIKYDFLRNCLDELYFENL